MDSLGEKSAPCTFLPGLEGSEAQTEGLVGLWRRANSSKAGDTGVSGRGMQMSGSGVSFLWAGE